MSSTISLEWLYKDTHSPTAVASKVWKEMATLMSNLPEVRTHTRPVLLNKHNSVSSTFVKSSTTTVW